jgi:ABC-type glutathione transport system ATPase component
VSALALRHVRVQRGGHTLVDGVSLEVGVGETVGLIGRSGAGKSTLVRVALALEAPAAGQVGWGGVDPHALAPAALRRARRHVAAVFQQPATSLDPRRTVAHSVAEPLATHEGTLGETERTQRVLAALARVGLAPSIAARRPAQLSGGEAQRVAIARALICAPALVILDEPTSALDSASAAGVLGLIRTLARETAVSFLIVSHDLAALAATTQRIVVLDAGRVVESGPTAALYAAPRSAALGALLDATR